MRRQGKRTTYGRARGIFFLILLFFLLGIVAGAFYAKTTTFVEQQQLQAYTSRFVSNGALRITKSDIFKEALIKYGKMIVIVWFLAFISIGLVINLGIVFYKGFSLGFTTAFFVMAYGLPGLYNCAILYLIQTIIFVPIFLLVTFASINYIVKRLANKKILLLEELLEYIIWLGIGCTSVVLVSLLEAYIVPLFLASIKI